MVIDDGPRSVFAAELTSQHFQSFLSSLVQVRVSVFAAWVGTDAPGRSLPSIAAQVEQKRTLVLHFRDFEVVELMAVERS